jgi:cytochrome c oxidase assembly protein subunit 15
MDWLKFLTRLCLILALCVATLGAYVRLSDAGLSCPDWPGCYGRITAPDSALDKVQAQAAFPDKPLDSQKAWREMTHRYLAASLGLFILAIALLSWKKRTQSHTSPALAFLLVGVVVFQGLLGMWTVTLLLKPVIVTLHLLGGMVTVGLLTWLMLKHASPPGLMTHTHGMVKWAGLGLILLFIQIALGGWVSANYAALACGGFPQCLEQWVPQMDFSHAFHLTRELGATVGGEVLPFEALVAIQWVHRVGALVVFLYLAWFAHRLMRQPRLRLPGSVLMGLLAVQIALGIANVTLSRPLGLAIAHNSVAQLLLLSLVVVNFRLHNFPR